VTLRVKFEKIFPMKSKIVLLFGLLLLVQFAGCSKSLYAPRHTKTSDTPDVMPVQKDEYYQKQYQKKR
jgi:hypothetical protein